MAIALGHRDARRGGCAGRAEYRRAHGIRPPDRPVRRGLRARAPLVHDHARARSRIRARSLSLLGRQLPPRHVRRPFHRRRSARRSSAPRTRRSGSSAAASSRPPCSCCSVPIPRPGSPPRKHANAARPPQAPAVEQPRRSRRRHRRGRHGLDPDVRAHRRAPHDVAEPGRARAARPGRRIPVVRPLGTSARHAAVGSVDRARRLDHRARRRHLGGDRLRPVLRQWPDHGPIRPAVGRPARRWC